MRKTLVALVAILLASLGTAAPAGAPVANAATGVKVAIIVGATHGSTARYRSNADEIYAEAIRYTPNVVKVYSPNATAARVKAAVAGASIVVYLGHGNGWPSPYTFDPNYTTKDGFGLNYDANGDGKTTDYENKYYGEPWIRDLRPAPNAVVLLFHLCYASGNPESGSEPSISKAKQRVDNYAAAFIRAGARAVIANGHSHNPYYISALFNTRQTIDEYWRNAPDFNDNVSTYASVRNPGYTFQLDPERAGSYYRAITGKMSLRTQDVTGAPFADTSADPASVIVPGNASPALDGAPIYGSVESAAAAGGAITTLAADARVRVEATEPMTAWADGSPIYRVRAGDVEGWMTGSALIPRDSAAPRVWEVDHGTGAFSPNGDESQDAMDLAVRLSEPAAWTMRIVDRGGNELATFKGAGDTAAASWAPPAGSIPDGTYRWVIRATDGWSNGPLEDDGTFLVDTARPDVSVADAEGGTPQFTPNGDGTTETARFAVGATEPGSITATILDAGGGTVGQVTTQVAGSTGAIAWDGRNEGGGFAADGTYTLRFVARDRAGNRSEAQQRTVNAYGSLGFVAASRTVFFPQDRDGMSATTDLKVTLRSPATISWSVRNAAGGVVRTIRTEEAVEAGVHVFAWDGRDDAGVLVPRGTYRSVVSATDGTLSATQQVAVVADAFRITVSDSTPARGGKLTVTATSAEVLNAAPTLRIYQPGKAPWTVSMRKVDTRVYRVTITLKSSRTGTMKLRVAAPDDGGRFQASYLSLVLH
ncbi:MAG TPA: FlgD immunoglobulin-like domain containing protein [Candidatus Limnocylindrales bacterium]|nr:FlgD immunoglobulin-like domain containing protein [Candidatus Limnocylindrales bacterium]